MDSEAKIHQNSALGVLEGLVRPWIELVEELAKARKPLKNQVERATNQLINLSAAELRARKKLCATYRACERTWFSHIQSIRARSKPTGVSDESNSLDNSKVLADSSPLSSSGLNRHARAYHSFRGGSIDLELASSSTLNTLDLPSQRASSLRRHCSARSATLPSPNSTAQSSDSSGMLSNKIAPAVNKTKEACYTTLCDYYRAAMSAEEARVEWHTVLLKCLNEQRSLERQRLLAMVNGLTVYQRIVNEAIPEVKSMATEITDALRLADPSADLDAFRKRSHAESVFTDADNPEPELAPMLSDIRSGCRSTEGVVGRSQQRLLEIPGERSMLQHLLSRQDVLMNRDRAQSPNDRTTLDKPFTKAIWSSGKFSSDLILRGHLRECLTRECVFEHLDLLAKDVQKERRTKQGLSNLVQVYSREPAYADAQTLVEVRRRLFVSRVRLTHLTNCRQKLVYSLICALSGGQNTTNNGDPPKHIYADALVRAGFTNLPWSPVPSSSSSEARSSVQSLAARWIPVPDLDDETTVNKLAKPLEWPPFPATELAYEDLNDDLFEWEIERLRLLDADQRDNGPWDSVPSPIPEPIPVNLKSPVVHIGTVGVARNTTATTATTTVTITAICSPTPVSPVNTDNNKTIGTNIVCNLKGTNGDSAHNFHLSKRWSGEYPSSNARSSSSVRPSQLKIGYPCPNGLSDPPSSRLFERSLGEKLGSPVDPGKRSVAIIARPEISILPKSPTLASQEPSDTDSGEPSSNSPAHLRRSASSGRSRLIGFSFARFRRPSSSVSVKRAQSFDHPTTPLDSKSTVTKSTHPTQPHRLPDRRSLEREETASAAVERQNDLQSFSSRFWSKLRSSGRQQSSHTKSVPKSTDTSLQSADSMLSDQLMTELTRVQCLRKASTDRLPSSVDPTTNGYSQRSVHFGAVESHAITPDVDVAPNGLHWPSNLSLHCVGWAKVERSYTAKSPDELTLLEGEIVSIYRKEDNGWWYGEANGCKGRFPVSHVDEF
ncbi:hypothetical protein FBUS_04529 [Fasciolopsis buskii]|uniref:SH3 domain-containing protein n=1 Tax=Fasciolopsis buskii TaxID=27845 RepID=A0A8E0VLY3_9TREM|nr:hypothetical protein FBUS_04529 [Fasciolopsis buski]